MHGGGQNTQEFQFVAINHGAWINPTDKAFVNVCENAAGNIVKLVGLAWNVWHDVFYEHVGHIELKELCDIDIHCNNPLRAVGINGAIQIKHVFIIIIVVHDDKKNNIIKTHAQVIIIT